PVLSRVMDILGLRVVEATPAERTEIEKLIAARNSLRSEKKFQQADEIRKKLYDMSVELMDHKGRTIWKKVEKAEKL
ncbi:MAG: cysteine--tRNA ligase, partial [Nitrososphaera sp.]|nr:cysteine--tRNA ligase [Nitrososphaera sp.]